MPRVHVRVVILWVCHCIASKPHNLNPQTFKKPLSHKNAKTQNFLAIQYVTITFCHYFLAKIMF